MNELISVIIPVYNRKAYLKECIDSVIAQSYGKFEIVIVDDGLTDGSVELFTAFGFKTKVLYYMCVYFPFSYPLVVRIKKILGKLR